MPELADVEGFRRVLAEHGTGHEVRRVAVADPDVVRNTSAQGLGRALKGRRFDEPARHGKWLHARTDGPAVLFHFGMTGALVWAVDEEPHPHDRVQIELDDGELRFRDQRKLKGLWLARDEDEASDIMGPLGPDALGLPRRDLAELLADRRGRLKPVLMDQEVIAGLGNELTDEILWQARLHPGRAARELDDDELDRLHKTMHKVLRASVRAGRIPAKQGWLNAVRNDKSPDCPRCGHPLEHHRIGGRGAWYCPNCQSDATADR